MSPYRPIYGDFKWVHVINGEWVEEMFTFGGLRHVCVTVVVFFPPFLLLFCVWVGNNSKIVAVFCERCFTIIIRLVYKCYVVIIIIITILQFSKVEAFRDNKALSFYSTVQLFGILESDLLINKRFFACCLGGKLEIE